MSFEEVYRDILSNFKENKKNNVDDKILYEWIIKLRKISYQWNEITKKPGYFNIRFSKRTWPYFTSENKEWRQLNKDISEENYTDIIDDNHHVYDDDEDTEDIQNNNFKSYDISDAVDSNEINNIVLMLLCLKLLEKNILLVEASIYLILNPNTCHIIFNSNFWKILDFNKEYKHIINWAMFYAMYILRHEDTILFSKVSNRTLLTYKSYISLPRFYDNMGLNPYVCYTEKGYVTEKLAFHLIGKREFTNPQEFHRRINMATGGCLKGLYFKKYNACLCGSLLYPCAVKSPLEKNFEGVKWDVPMFWKDDDSFNYYLEFYYPSYYSLSNKEFKESTKKPHNIVSSIDVNFDKVYIENEGPVNSEKKITDIDIAIYAKTFKDYIKSSEAIYEHIKKNVKDKIYFSKITTASSFKFAITGPGLIRPIEMFRIHYNHARMTKKFHLPNVRAYFEGTIGSNDMEGLYCHRTFINSSISGINEDYKWFSCNKVPIEIKLKSAQRGISTIINDAEKKTAKMWIKTSKKYEKIKFGAFCRNHEFFISSKYGIRQGLIELSTNVKISNGKIPISYKPTYTEYNKILKVDIKNKNINPPDLDIVRAFMEYYKEKEFLNN